VAESGLWDSLARLVADREYTVERRDCGSRNGYTNFISRTGVDPGQVVRATGQRVLAAARAILAVTQPEITSSPAVTTL